jgi:RNAse (barnase) inhibitor barstar
MSDSGFDIGLQDPARAGLYRIAPGDVPSLAAAARDAGLLARRIDLGGCRDKQTLLLRIATALDLPSGSGRNWDALMDALRDLSWLPAPGYVLLFESVSQFQGARPRDLQALAGVLQEAAQWWAGADVPFWAFLALDDGDATDGGTQGADR